ncbi:MAG: hypothetical protein J0L61_07795, partial [Planctomycetes bacterium]|nr:hypothetical protein [Planctomycetota bacterium]
MNFWTPANIQSLTLGVWVVRPPSAESFRAPVEGVATDSRSQVAGRAFVAYLQAKRIAVSCDMRLSSPAMKAAFIDGAREQGADVVDYGMLGTDMMYFAVCRDGLD